MTKSQKTKNSFLIKLPSLFSLIQKLNIKLLIVNEPNNTLLPKNLIEKFENIKIADTGNFLDLSNQKEEFLQIQKYLKNLEEIGFKINIYIIDSIPDEYFYEFFNKFKNSEAYLKEISQLLFEKYIKISQKALWLFSLWKINSLTFTKTKASYWELTKKIKIILKIIPYVFTKKNFTLKREFVFYFSYMNIIIRRY